MTRKFLLFFLVGLGCWTTSQAQDPSVGGIAAVPSSVSVGGAGTVQTNFGNTSSTSIPQANAATWIISLPPNIGVTSFSITSSPSNLTTTVGTYSPTTGTTVTIVSSLGAVPGNASYLMTLKIVGLTVTGGAPISINASTTPPVGTNNSTNDNASGTVIVTAGALPVSLVSFTAKAQEDRTVALNWIISMASNNKGFLVERSKDLKVYERVGEVSEVVANSQAQQQYSLVDNKPYSGTSYYRLTQIDLNGRTTSYPVVSVQLRNDYGVSPNPVLGTGLLTLRLDEPETAEIKFLSVSGRLLPLQKVGIESGNLLLKPLSALPAGIYILTVEERGQTRQHRLVVE